jgi:K+/H+ antiporter YhaU regulatory subunit KhtT
VVFVWLDVVQLSSLTRVLVVAVVRDGMLHLNPEPDYVFREGDILVLVGDHAALEAAFEALSPAGAR